MAVGQSDSYTTHRQQKHINASDFFHALEGAARDIANEEAERMANTMVNVLHNRLGLGAGNGRFPRYNPMLPNAKGKKSYGKSKKMFATWEKQQRGGSEFWIFTDGIDPEHHNYAQQLVSGKGWSDRVKNGKHVRLVDGGGGRLFSTQMPRGLDPWLKLKRELFKSRVDERISQELG